MSSLIPKVIHCLFLLLCARGSAQAINDVTQCEPSRCGENGPPIRFPFRLKRNASSGPSNERCGYPGFDLLCVGNATALELPAPGGGAKRLFVTEINYQSQEIYLQSPEKCFTEEQSWRLPLNLSASPFEIVGDSGFTLFNCPLEHSSNWYEIGPECLSDPSRSVHSLPSGSDLVDSLSNYVSCSKMFDIPSGSYGLLELFLESTASSFPLMKWSKPDCGRCEMRGESCRLKEPRAGRSGLEHVETFETECFDSLRPRKGPKKFPYVTTGAILGSIFVIVVITAIFYVYTLDKNERENRKRIEQFLEDYKACNPSRYTYGDIKKITNQFKEKLGEGAYGRVFKGKLSNDIFVAVKILNNTFNGNGEEFINEVATMGRIHHLNVVRMVGFCADGFNRALVYEFLPNGSLEKYISSPAGGENQLLNWATLQDIAHGIAKGIDYLHQGCDQRILHFDIKPHNVLLDENFTPKIADFGMAKLCSKDQSIVSMTTARGTLGYIAPEVFSRNFGNVSYKSDVYSFGMLLLEMVGGRKNTTTSTDEEDNTEHIYYPEWIYNLLEDGEDLRIRVEEEGDATIAKRLAIVGLWCIQWHPVSRPTMKIAVQMLEGDEELAMPPNPFASSGASETYNLKIPARALALELETIAE